MAAQSFDSSKKGGIVRLSIVLILITIAIAGCANTEILRDPHACWQHPLSEKNNHNVVTFCVAADKAAKSVFFPNASFPGYQTSCRHAGVMVIAPGGGMNLDFESGSCENGRTFRADKLTCLANENRSLSCRFSDESLPDI